MKIVVISDIHGNLEALDAVLEDKPTPVSGKDGLAPVLIAIAAQESLNSGKPVKVASV